MEDRVATIYAGNNGYLDKLEVTQVRTFVAGFRSFLGTNDPKYGLNCESNFNV